MKTMRRTFRLALAVMAALILTSLATQPVAAATASGTGALTAQGVGTARIEGDGSVVIEAGAGTVWVNGATSIVVEGRGRRTTLADGTVRLTGYSGRISITGEELVVRIAGGAISFTATGSGSVVLAGRGSYSVGEQSGVWTKRGVTVGY